MKHCIPGHGPAGVIVQLEAGEEVGFVVEGGEECVGCFDGIVGCFAGRKGGAVCFVVDEVGGDEVAGVPDCVEVVLEGWRWVSLFVL